MNDHVRLTPEQRTIATQRERIEELEEELRQTREMAKQHRFFPYEWKLTPSQSKLLGAMLDAVDGYLDQNRAYDLLNGDTKSDDVLNIVRVQIWGLRKALQPIGVSIITRWGSGYELPSPSRAIVKAALEQRISG